MTKMIGPFYCSMEEPPWLLDMSMDEPHSSSGVDREKDAFAPTGKTGSSVI
jgi:hypothetical protein